MSKSKKPAPLDYREGEESKPPEGEDMEDAAKPPHSRKRSAKGAKHTKAPMDGEGDKSSCPCGKRPKGKCNCGKADAGMCGMKSRSDALTAPEYLAACELGIQGRSRAYIRARLDSAARLDLKCGRSGIAPGKKCTKSTAQAAPTKQYKGGNVAVNTKAAQRLRIAARAVSTVGSLAPLAGMTRGGVTGMVAGFGAASTAFKAAGALENYARAQETGSKVGRERLQKEAKSQAVQAGASLVSSAAGAVGMGLMARRQRRSRSNRETLEQIYRGPSARRRDSIWADGFSPELDQLAI